MIRGTTPTHHFTAPCDPATIAKVNLLYAQDDTLLFKKLTSDFKIEDNKISTKLTREETLLFNHKKPAQVQAVIETTSGDIIESIVITIGVDKLLDDGVVE
jgi:hypothetical protein